jgi:hypothetical protein
MTDSNGINKKKIITFKELFPQCKLRSAKSNNYMSGLDNEM